MVRAVGPADYSVGGMVISILEMVISIISIFVNSLVIYILVNRFRLKQSDFVVSFWLCLVDIVFAAYSAVSLIVIWITDHEILQDDNYYCQFNGYIFYVTGTVTIQTISILAVLRYLGICHGKLFSTNFWVSWIVTSILFSIGLGVYPVINKFFTVFPATKYCSIAATPHLLPNIYYYAVCFMIMVALWIVIICYYQISRFYLKFYKDISQESAEVTTIIHPKDNVASDHVLTYEKTEYDPNQMKSSIRKSITKLYLMVFIYVLQAVPFLTIQAVYRLLGHHEPRVLDNITSLFSHCMPLSNPVFILFFHEETNQEFQAILSIFWFQYFKSYFTAPNEANNLH